MLRKVLVSAVTLSLAGGTAALAQDADDARDRPGRGPGQMFERLDTDDNGTISPGEFGGERLEMLRAADADGDGTLTREELVTYVMDREFKRRADRAARLLDIDGDGTVTLAEIEDHQGKRFALLDRDNDGELGQDELRRSTRMMHMRGMGEHGPRFAMRGRDHGPGHHKFMRRMHRMEPAAPAAPADEAPTEE